MTDVVIQHELVRIKVRKRLAWILFRRQRISLEKNRGKNDCGSYNFIWAELT